MNELAFSAIGLLALFAVAVPILTLVCKAMLVLRRSRGGDIVDGSDAPALGSMSSYLLIVAPVLVPAVWLVSAGLHQSEPGWSSQASGVSHLAGQACYNALVLAAVVALLLVAAFARRHNQQRAEANDASCRRQAARLDSICAPHPILARLRHRVIVAERGNEALRVIGVFQPAIAISAELMGELDDQALSGALLHEAEHLRSHDSLRYLLGSVCLSLNPLAFLLRPELKRWMLAREITCDRAAVQNGAEPLSLAEAIVVAARPGRSALPQATASLAGGEVRFVRLRVGLLLAYASATNLFKQRQAPLFTSAIALLAATVLLPHAIDAWPLDGLHLGIEALLALAGIG